jgi:hypothetical protein
MNATAPKLAELRAKTDRELVKIIGNAMEVSVLVAPPETQGNSVPQVHSRAHEIYSNTLMLIPKVEDMNERRRLEDRVKVFREALQRRLE